MAEDLRSNILCIASELPVGDTTRRELLAVVKDAGSPGWDIMKTVIGEKDYRGLLLVRRNLSGATPASTQTADLLAKSLSALADKLDVDRNTMTAINKLRNLANSGERLPFDAQRNQIFKIADLLGLKLPSGMF